MKNPKQIARYAELSRLADLPPPATTDPVGSAFGFLATMRGLTS